MKKLKDKVEIERKFLVKDDWKEQTEIIDSGTLVQGYLNDERTIRIRVSDECGYITIKEKKLLKRYEYEYEIPRDDALQLLRICKGSLIKKKRYFVFDVIGHAWFVDKFFGDNEGLVMMEIELEDENEQIDLPEWVDEEVTHDPRYYNSYLVDNPYKNWREQ